MDTASKYDQWKASRPALQRWMEGSDSAATVTTESRLLAWMILLAAIGIAAYLTFRYRAQIRSVVKFTIAAVIIFAIKAARYVQAEALDIRAQVERVLDQPRSRVAKSPAASDQEQTGRLRLAGRTFFNLMIAPLLLGTVLIGVVVAANKLGLLE